jgi:ubiquinone/menaquinone biosynthesis C-methylase UbiE
VVIRCGVSGISGPNGCPALSVGVDIDCAALCHGSLAHRDAEFVNAQAAQLPFADAFFDFIASSVALQYMDVLVAVREIFRVLKPGGKVASV